MIRFAFVVCVVTVTIVFSATSCTLASGILYAIDRANDTVYEIDPSNGNSSILGTIGFDASFSGLSYDGQAMYASDVFNAGWSLATIDLGSGAGTTVGPQSVSNLMAIAHANGTLYGFEFTDGLGTVDTQTGLFQDIPDTLPVPMYAADVDESTGIMYAVGDDENLYTIDPLAGTAALVGPTGVSFQVVNSVKSIGLAYNSMNGQLYMLGNDVAGSGDNLYSVDKNTGTATFIGTTLLSEADALEFVVPEPTAWALASFCLGYLATARSGRR